MARPSDALEARDAAEMPSPRCSSGWGRSRSGRRGRHRQRDGDLGAGTPGRDRPAPRARCDQAPHAIQFLGEALLLAVIGGVGGVILGSAVTAGYASIRGWGILIPEIALIGGFAAAILIGAIAGLYPALRAARLSPTEALRTT